MIRQKCYCDRVDQLKGGYIGQLDMPGVNDHVTGSGILNDLLMQISSCPPNMTNLPML